MNTDKAERREPSSRPGDHGEGTKQALAKGGEQVKGEVARATSEMRQKGGEVASTAVEQADRYATEQKEAGAEHVASFARAVDRAADELERSSPELARYAHQAASSVDKLSDTLRQRSVRDLIDESNDFARREPALFFGAAVIAGMVISRFLRSSEDHDSSARHAGDVASGSKTSTAGRYS